MNWIEAISHYNQLNQPFVLITVLKTQGSTPRNCDAKMVANDAECHDTIGGGLLEFKAIETARKLLAEHKRCSITEEFNLGKDLAQCCGGRVTLLFECFVSSQFEIALFGAGHVGTALIEILGALPCRVRWFDSRADSFKSKQAGNVQTILMQNPEQAVEACSPKSWFLVMTHSHELDQQLIEAILARGDSQYCGLIGSKSKAASFRGRLQRKGFTENELEQMTSPIGLESIKGKSPMEIAVSVTAQLLALQKT